MTNPISIEDIQDDAIADAIGCVRFTCAMLIKLEKKRDAGRGGWNHPYQCSVGHLRKMLSEHVPKCDMVDIANFAMMIWNREHLDGELRDEEVQP